MPEQGRERFLGTNPDNSSDEFVTRRIREIRDEIEGVSSRVDTQETVVDGEVLPPISLAGRLDRANSKPEKHSSSNFKGDSADDSNFALKIVEKRNRKKAA